MLLDFDDPEKIIGLTKTSILAPYEPYEFNGIVPNTVFPAGFIADWKHDELRIYYGAADTCVGLATGSVRKLVELCEKEI